MNENTIEINDKELKKYCRKIYTVVGEKLIKEEQVSSEIVSNYYSKSAFYYKKFHSPEGAIHLPVSFSEKESHGEKLLYQAKSIDKIINTHNYSNILELGCGMGFNTNYLAKKNPGKKFTGVDLTADNIKQAKKNATDSDNSIFLQGDFDDPETIQGKYDLIFAVETLCHSNNLIELILNYRDKLADNGRMIIFDAYVKKDAKVLKGEFEQKAYHLLLWGFALNQFQKMSDILDAEKLISIESITDYTVNVAPNAIVFQKAAIKVLRFHLFLKLLLKTGIVSIAFIKQLSAGLFGPYFGHTGYLGYYKIVITK
ncbi:MAG: methyltransferase domain-containing protein [Bacteroidales bacterium]|nr:methyltransferase domain-containing protein [Bacteroidales bacterium]